MTDRIFPGAQPHTPAVRPGEPAPAARPRKAFLHREPFLLAGLAGAALTLIVIALAPMVAPLPPLETDYDAILQPPGPVHWFGTDYLGRDVFSRVVWGGRISLPAALAGTAAALAAGTLLGALAGFWGGPLDTLVMRLADILLSFPAILLLLGIIALLGPGLQKAVLALAITAVPKWIRLIRAGVLEIRHAEYVQASRALGAAPAQILWDHILPNIAPLVTLQAVIQVSAFLLAASGLSFLGLGAQPPSPEWGAMLNDGRNFFRQAWWLLAFPGLALFCTSFWINLCGEGLRRMAAKKASGE